MRVFVTGASGFVGSAVVQELLAAGHTVLGMVRSDSAAEKIKAMGAEVHRGDIYEPETLRSGAVACDAVIHTAFNHDFSAYKEHCETDRRVIATLASALNGTDKPLVVTSGIGLVAPLDGPVRESDGVPSAELVPRAASEEAAAAAMAEAVDTYIVRLPPSVHGQGDHGFVPMLIGIAKEKGVSAFIDAGDNRWPAVHRSDAARLYRLAIERRPALKVLHAVHEKGIAFAAIARAIGDGLGLATVSYSGAEADAHFGWFRHFAGIDAPATADATRAATGWEPAAAGLLEDIRTAGYFA